MQAPVWAFQSHTVNSSVPARMTSPLGCQCSHSMAPPGPSSMCLRCPEGASQMPTLPASPHSAITHPFRPGTRTPRRCSPTLGHRPKKCLPHAHLPCRDTDGLPTIFNFFSSQTGRQAIWPLQCVPALPKGCSMPHIRAVAEGCLNHDGSLHSCPQIA